MRHSRLTGQRRAIHSQLKLEPPLAVHSARVAAEAEEYKDKDPEDDCDPTVQGNYTMLRDHDDVHPGRTAVNEIPVVR